KTCFNHDLQSLSDRFFNVFSAGHGLSVFSQCAERAMGERAPADLIAEDQSGDSAVAEQRARRLVNAHLTVNEPPDGYNAQSFFRISQESFDLQANILIA